MLWRTLVTVVLKRERPALGGPFAIVLRFNNYAKAHRRLALLFALLLMLPLKLSAYETPDAVSVQVVGKQKVVEIMPRLKQIQRGKASGHAWNVDLPQR